MADVLTNKMGNVLVVAPAPKGRLDAMVEQRNVVLQRGGEPEKGIVRWVFADVPHLTLSDDWGNRYDHQVHSLLCGDLAAGEEFVEGLIDQGYTIKTAEHLFVPLQTLDPSDQDSSDRLRFVHPRAFALASRQRKSPEQLITSVRDRLLTGD